MEIESNNTLNASSLHIVQITIEQESDKIEMNEDTDAVMKDSDSVVQDRSLTDILDNKVSAEPGKDKVGEIHEALDQTVDCMKSMLDSPMKVPFSNSLSDRSTAEPPALSDTLDAAINEALTAEMSFGSLSFFDKSVSNFLPANTVDSGSNTSNKGSINISTVIKTLKSVLSSSQKTSDLSGAVKTTVIPPKSSQEQNEMFGPAGKTALLLSEKSSFEKVFPQQSITRRTDSKSAEFNCFNAGSTKLSADIMSDLSKSPPFSPFSPFSPFGQEIQNITAAASAAFVQSSTSPSTSRAPSAASKVRRITPIPVKEAGEKTDSSSSFQTAVMNSPLISDSPIKKNPFENITGEKSSFSISPLCVNSVTSGSDIMFGAVLATSCQDSGSNSKASGGSQTSSSNGNTNQGITSITISLPEVFSENANVGFPRLVPQNQQPCSILSEESLFQCLSKPINLNDSIPTVSNLTNILNALDGKSQAFESVKTVDESEAVESDKNALRVPADLTHTKDKEAETKGSSEGSNSLNVEPVETGQHFPQSVQSIDNITRLEPGLVKVSSLSDSDSSNKTSPSKSLTKNKVTSETVVIKELAQCEENQTEMVIDNLDERNVGRNPVYDGESVTDTVTDINDAVQSETSEKPGTGIAHDSSSRMSPEKRQGRKRLKMSRRELRKSLHGIADISVDHQASDNPEKHRLDSGGTLDIRSEIASPETKTENVEPTVLEEATDEISERLGLKETCDTEKKGTNSSEVVNVKTEVDLDDEANCDSMSNFSNKKRTKRKKSDKKKKKKRKEDQESDGSGSKERNKKRRRAEKQTERSDKGKQVRAERLFT